MATAFQDALELYLGSTSPLAGTACSDASKLHRGTSTNQLRSLYPNNEYCMPFNMVIGDRRIRHCDAQGASVEA
eukprot:2790304-Pleurochrysis_carterae.AAC.6